MQPNPKPKSTTPPSIGHKRPGWLVLSDPRTVDGVELGPGLWRLENSAQGPRNTLVARLEPVGVLLHIERGAYGVQVRWQTPHGKTREAGIWIEQASRAQGWEEIVAELRGAGLRVEAPKLLRQWVLDYVHSVPDVHDRTIAAADRCGWHETDTGMAFVLPDWSAGADIRYAGDPLDTDPRGSLEGWREHVYCQAWGSWPLELAIYASLSAPLLAILGDTHSAGIHIYGDSSKGKTTALRCAASVWGSDRLIRTWRATVNGLEGFAAAMCDLPLLVDEIGEGDREAIARAIYMISDGVGKTRSTRTGREAMVRRWRVALISTGEQASHSVLGNSLMVGQAVRVLDIPIPEYGAIVAPDPAKKAMGLSQACREHYGHAGRALVEHLVTLSGADIMARRERLYSELLAQVRSRGYEPTASQMRALRSMARIALAGQLAHECGVIKCHAERPMDAVLEATMAWLASDTTPVSETEMIAKRVRSWLIANIGKLCSLDESRPEHRTHPVMGWIRRSGMGAHEQVTYYLPAETLREASGGFTPVRAARALRDVGWIRAYDGRLTTSIRVAHGFRPSVYEIEVKDEP